MSQLSIYEFFNLNTILFILGTYLVKLQNFLLFITKTDNGYVCQKIVCFCTKSFKELLYLNVLRPRQLSRQLQK